MKEKAGSIMTPEDIQAAWEFFDPENRGSVTLEDIRKKLGVFYRDVSSKEVKFLMSNHSEITKAELEAMLRETKLVNFDPVKEAFKLYDPRSTGYLDKEQLQKFLHAMGYGQVSDADIATIVTNLDIDQDGKIGIDDFKAAINSRSTHKP